VLTHLFLPLTDAPFARLLARSHSIHLPTSRPVAIKQIDLEDSDDDIAEIQLEIAHLSDCDSEWVTRYYGSFLRGWKLWIGEFGLSEGER
jgi:hypothetical protein